MTWKFPLRRDFLPQLSDFRKITGEAKRDRDAQVEAVGDFRVAFMSGRKMKRSLDDHTRTGNRPDTHMGVIHQERLADQEQ